MHKEDIVREVSHRVGTTKKLAAEVLDGVLDVMSENLVKGEEIHLYGFGTMRTRKRIKSRFDFKAGTVDSEAVGTVFEFKPSKKLKELVRKDG